MISIQKLTCTGDHGHLPGLGHTCQAPRQLANHAVFELTQLIKIDVGFTEADAMRGE